MITHIVSDMGGVLVELQWQERVEKLLNRPLPMEDLHRLWVSAPSTVDFESGRTDFDQFAAAFIQEFDLAVTPATLQQEFLEIVQAPLPHCDQLLRALKPRYHLSLLSNTNPAHYHKLRDRYSFFDHFDQLFLSYQLGVMKPSPAIFEYLLERLGTDAATVVFFDDGARNVEAARCLGIQAFQVESPDQIWAVVSALDPGVAS